MLSNFKLLFLLIFLFGCEGKKAVKESEIKTDKEPIETSAASVEKEKSHPVESSDNCLNGIWEWVNPFNSDDLTENNYIRLSCGGGETSGSYYGTSDDFDEAREGYLPGFFKAEMQNLEMTDSTIHYKVVVGDADFFTTPLTPSNEKADERWDVGVRYNERIYSGTINGDSIIIESEDMEPRIFVKNNKTEL